MLSSRESLEQLARMVLARSAISRPPVDIYAILRGFDLIVWRMSFDRLLGAYLRERSAIAVGSHQHPLQQRFTLAHELAHHLEYERQDGPLANPYLVLRNGRGRTEHQAHDFFAASLLMPRAWVQERGDRQATLRTRDVADVAREFGVTKAAARARLHELRIAVVASSAIATRSRGRCGALYAGC